MPAYAIAATTPKNRYKEWEIAADSLVDAAIIADSQCVVKGLTLESVVRCDDDFAGVGQDRRRDDVE
jgi:hypothetical protein